MIACLVVTLVLLVEIARHRLDHAIHGKPFAEEVVESCYRELTILGIVEFGIFLLFKFDPDFSLDVEKQFATAHFALFATAIIYSLSLVVVAFISFNISSNWQVAENMELDHYVEVRHAFETLRSDLNIQLTSETHSVRRRIYLFFNHPVKYRQYNLLLEQVRFHKLRAHFVKSNNLPKDFPMSEYLNSCQRNILISLVQLRQGTWLALLCGLVLFFYFGTLEENLLLSPNHSLGRMLAGATSAFTSQTDFHITAFVFFEGSCLAVLVIGVLIKLKMDSIFQTMMHDDDLIEPARASKGSDDLEEVQKIGGTVQIDLFWRRDPNLIISLYQYMCFLYAVLAGILSMYGPDIEDITIPGITWAGTFVLSIMIASYFMPRYTLCVSVGQLVDRVTLNESLSDYRLKKLQESHKRGKRQRKHKKRIKHIKEGSDNSANTFFSAPIKVLSGHFRKKSTPAPPPQPPAILPTPKTQGRPSSPELTPMTSAHVDNLVHNFSKKNEAAANDFDSIVPPLSQVHFTPHLPHVTAIDTSARASYRTDAIPPTPAEYHETPFRPRKNDNHHSSASIRWLDIANYATMDTAELPLSTAVKPEGRPRPRRRKSISDTAKILMMSAVKPKVDNPERPRTPNSTGRRRSRKRSISDGVAAMRSPSTLQAPSPVTSALPSPSPSPTPVPPERVPTPSSRSPMRPHKRLESVCEVNPSNFKDLRVDTEPPSNQVEPIGLSSSASLSPSNSYPTSSKDGVGDYIPISTKSKKKKSDPTTFPISHYDEAVPSEPRRPTVVIDIPGHKNPNCMTSPVSEWALSPASTVQSTSLSVATHVRISELCSDFYHNVAKLFHEYWREISHVLTIATVFTLAARANYLVQFQYPGAIYAIDFTSGVNWGAMIGTAFWFSFCFLCIMIMEGIVQLVRGNWTRAIVDLPLTIAALICIIVSEAFDYSKGNFGARYPYRSSALDYVPVIVIVRLVRVHLSGLILSYHKHLHSDVEERMVTKHKKSLEAQRKFDESRSVKGLNASAVIQDQHKIGTIAELWYKAVKTHVKVVEDHGAFSGELLRAMLEVAEEKEKDKRREGRYTGAPEEVRDGVEGESNSNDTSRTTTDTDGDGAEEGEEEGYDDDSVGDRGDMEGFHKPTNSFETIGLPSLPSSRSSNIIFRSAFRRMPPLLVDWQNVIFCVDREHHDITYFDVATESFLGRIQLAEVTRVTLSATETKSRASVLAVGGLASLLPGGNNSGEGNNQNVQEPDLENPDIVSPLSHGAVSLKSSGSLRSRAGKHKVLTAMILLRQGQIMHVKFGPCNGRDGNTIARDFANALCQLTGLVLLDGTMKRTQKTHRKRISLKW